MDQVTAGLIGVGVGGTVSALTTVIISLLNPRMKIFLSYASEDCQIAETICWKLRGAGYKVFFDRDNLSPGESFDSKIKRQISDSDLFVFLLTRESIRSGSYTLTELKIAKKTWEHPKEHVLVVNLGSVTNDEIPSYPKAVTYLSPEGDPAAEVLFAVQQLWKKRVILVVSVFIVIYIAAFLVMAIPVPKPIGVPHLVFRVILAVASAGSTVLSLRFIMRLRFKTWPRYAIAMFVITYLFIPANVSYKYTYKPLEGSTFIWPGLWKSIYNEKGQCGGKDIAECRLSFTGELRAYIHDACKREKPHVEVINGRSVAKDKEHGNTVECWFQEDE